MAQKYYDEHGNEVTVEGRAPKKRGGCMKWALIIVGAFVVLGIISAMFGGDDTSTEPNEAGTEETTSIEETTAVEEVEVEEELNKPETNEPTTVEEAEVEIEKSEQEPEKDSREVEEEPEEEKKEPVEEAPREPEVSREFQNAQQTAEDYLAYSSFSKSGLYDQLLFEGYPEDAAQYAVNKMDEGVNWDIQALETAKDYLEYSSFSDQGLYEQLLFEGFTEGQAQYAIDNLD